MRNFLTLLMLVTASGAQAHPGHLAGLAGHDHWAAGVAIGLAIAAGLYGAAKGKKKPKAEPEIEAEAEGEPA